MTPGASNRQDGGIGGHLAGKLQEHFAEGCLFDPEARGGSSPPDDERSEGPTFYDFTREYVRRK